MGIRFGGDAPDELGLAANSTELTDLTSASEAEGGVREEAPSRLGHADPGAEGVALVREVVGVEAVEDVGEADGQAKASLAHAEARRSSRPSRASGASLSEASTRSWSAAKTPSTEPKKRPSS